MNQKLSGLSVVFPAFNDEQSIPILIKKTLKILPSVAKKYEIIIVNDGSKDNTRGVLKSLKKKNLFLKIVNHKTNMGYGATLWDGFRRAKYEFVFYTDGDGQYDVLELKNLIKSLDNKTGLVSGFKLNRADSLTRTVIGKLYNRFVKIIFNLRVQDVDCDFRLFRREILKDLNFTATGGSFDVEFIKKLQSKNVRFKETGVHHYPRLFGKSQFFQPARVLKSLWELRNIAS